jgi:hypothetical protein
MATKILETKRLTILQLDDAEHEWVQDQFDQIAANEATIEMLSVQNKKLRKRAWKAIGERFPETKDTLCQIHGNIKTIDCLQE